MFTKVYSHCFIRVNKFTKKKKDLGDQVRKNKNLRVLISWVRDWSLNSWSPGDQVSPTQLNYVIKFYYDTLT